MNMDRRSFIQYALSTTASMSIGGWSALEASENDMPYRELGATGEQVSLLCLGGDHIGRPDTDREAVRIMRTAIEEGVNFFDNAWHYNGGGCERRMGKALQDGYRDRVFLMTKHHGRTPGKAEQHLQDSLERLQVDTIDLWQFHHLASMSSVDRIYNSGVLEFAREMQRNGTIRYIGFTGHKHPRIHRAMIERGFDWDTVQCPVNPLDYHYHSFTREIVPLAVEKDIGVIAMKTLAAGNIPSHNLLSAPDTHRYVMSLPVSTICTGMESMSDLKQNLNTVKNKDPMDEQEIDQALNQVETEGSDGRHEVYK